MVEEIEYANPFFRQRAHCAACGNEFDVEPGAYIKESKPLTTEQLRGDE